MGRLIIHRERALWMDRLRSYEVLVDGVARGEVGNGETLEIDLEPRSHHAQMKIDWCRSREVLVDGSVDTRLICETGATPFLVLFYVLFRRKDYIKLRRA